MVTEVRNFVLMSLKEQLESMSYQITLVSADTDDIDFFYEETEICIIYAEEEILQQNNGLVLIKDWVLMKEIPLFVVGRPDEVKELKNIIPEEIISKEFLRPANVERITKRIDKYVKDYLEHNKKIILLVDDSGVALRSIKGWLDDKYRILMANSGTNAIKRMTLCRPDLILLDYAMPICDGKQVLEMIRAEKEFADIPVIFLTNKSDKNSIMKVKKLNPEGYLLKSMEREEIIRFIDEFFEKQKGQI
jgi:CheY-like chemotaxis protein